MSPKIRIGIIFGGKSAEHEVSLQSAKNVIEAIDKDKYELTLIGIDKSGQWFLYDAATFLLNADDPQRIKLNPSNAPVVLLPGQSGDQLINLSQANALSKLDVVFPVLHGTYGEDGTIQGLLKLADIPFVGAGVLGAAVTMDKDVMKRLVRDAGIPTSKFLTFHQHLRSDIDFEAVTSELGSPLFIKPANMGSSVGISKAADEAEFWTAIDLAFQFDHKLIVEEFIDGREIECAVLGNEYPMTSLPGEVIAHHDFYSYEAKYIDADGARLVIPAKLPIDMIKRVQKMAVNTFKTLCCEGMARVDVFLTKNGRLYVNELNAIPGFTAISMYPKLWAASGIPYAKLIDHLIRLALDRHKREKLLKIAWS